MSPEADHQLMTDETARRFTSMFKHSHKTLILARRMEGTTDHLLAYAYRLMGFILQAGPVSITEIGRKLGIAKSNVSTTVNRLARQGYLERIPSQIDRRVIHIVVTPQGQKEMKDAQNRLNKAFARYFARLSIRDQKRLNRALSQVEDLLQKLY